MTSLQKKKENPKTPQKNKKPKTKKDKIRRDRVVVFEVDKDILPDDAVFKGYQNVVVQEIIIKTDNIEYRKEIYYSPSQNKTYMGKTPSEIEGEFGPGVKSAVLTLKHVANVSESKIHEFMDNFDIHITPSTIFRIITKKNGLFHLEKADIFRALLLVTGYQQMDDTSSNVHSQNHYALNRLQPD